MLEINKNFVSKLIFLLVVFISLTNLNGVLSMLTGISGLVTPVLFLLCLSCIYLNLSKLKFSYGELYILTIIVYLLFSLLFLMFTSHGKPQYLLTYTASIAVVYSVYCYCKFNDFEKVIQYILFISMIPITSIFFSKQLFEIYLNPPMFMERFSGFFANANEGGILGVLALILSLRSFDRTKSPIYLMTALVCIIAVLLTFSKSSVLAMILVFLYLIILKSAVMMMLPIVLLCVLGFIFSEQLLDLISMMSESQRVRVEHLFLILSGEIGEETTTGRIELWGIGLNRIAENGVLFGSGMGSFHSLVGGVLSGDTLGEGESWLGVHQTYLMILGEAGLLVFLLFVAVNIKVLKQLIKLKAHYFILCFIVLQLDYFAAHNVWQLRFHCVFLGIVLAYLSLDKSIKWKF